ncbi:MAG: phospholipase, partial [Acinetobacter sp.]|nr:phospholipase [Acinetobacter sp.]
MRIVQKIQQRLQWSKRRYFTILVLLIVLTYIASAIYHSVKPLPQGLDFAGQSYAADVEFLYDDVQLSAQGQVQGTAQIFPKMLAMVAQAKTTIVLDSFLFNATAGEQQSHYPDQAAQLAAALIQKKREFPNMNIHIMLDPINTWYGATSAAHLQQLKQAGIDVQYTDLSQLRTPNPMWSAWWYMCCQSLGNSEQGWLNAPWTQDKITVRSYLNLFNLRANHRKVLITDSEQGWHTLISSANIHKGSAYHRNVAFLIHGAFAQDALKSEQAIAQFSGGNVPSLLIAPSSQGEAMAQLLTEQQIYQRALQMITQAKQGATLDVMMFYL